MHLDFGHPTSFITDSFKQSEYRDAEIVGVSSRWQTMAMIGKLVFGLSLTLTIPSVFQIFRFAIGLLLVGVLGWKEPTKKGRGMCDNTTMQRKVLSTVLMCVTAGLALLISLAPNGVGWVCMLLDLVTVVSGNPIMFLFPALCYLKNNPRDRSLHKFGAYFLILFCIIASGIGSIAVKDQCMDLFKKK